MGEKHKSRTFSAVAKILLACLLLVIILVPATVYAAEESNETTPEASTDITSPEEATSYSIRINLSFADGSKANYTVEAYLEECQDNVFLIKNEDNLYLTAVYSEENSAYIVTGTTSSTSANTHFVCGNDVSDPGVIQIRGLSEGNYTIITGGVTEGYLELQDIEISILEGVATVSGHEVSMDDHCVLIGIQLAPDPSDTESYEDIVGYSYVADQGTILGFALVCISVILLFMLLRNKSWKKNADLSDDS